MCLMHAMCFKWGCEHVLSWSLHELRWLHVSPLKGLSLWLPFISKIIEELLFLHLQSETKETLTRWQVYTYVFWVDFGGPNYWFISHLRPNLRWTMYEAQSHDFTHTGSSLFSFSFCPNINEKWFVMGTPFMVLSPSFQIFKAASNVLYDIPLS